MPDAVLRPSHRRTRLNPLNDLMRRVLSSFSSSGWGRTDSGALPRKRRLHLEPPGDAPEVGDGASLPAPSPVIFHSHPTFWHQKLRYIPLAALTNYHAPGSFKQQQCVLSSSGGRKSKSRCRQGHVLSGELREEPSLASPSSRWLSPLLDSWMPPSWLHFPTCFFSAGAPKTSLHHSPFLLAFLVFASQLLSFILPHVLEPLSPILCVHSCNPPRLTVTSVQKWLLKADSDFSCWCWLLLFT